MSDEKSIEHPARSAGDADAAVAGTARTMREYAPDSARSGPSLPPLFEKFKSEHITQFLNQSIESDVARHETSRGDRWCRLAYVISGIGVFAFLTALLLSDRSDLYIRILQGMGVFGSGLAAGYGIRACHGMRSACRRGSDDL